MPDNARVETRLRQAASALATRSRVRGGCRRQAGWKAPTSSITRSNGPRRSRICAYSVVSPVSPLKNHRVPLRTDDERGPQGRVAVVQIRRRERCCEGAGGIVSAGAGRLAIADSRARRCAAAARPRLRRCAPTRERRSRTARPRLEQLADGRVVEMVVVVVRHVARGLPAASHEAERAPAGNASGRRAEKRSARPPDRIGEHTQRRRSRPARWNGRARWRAARLPAAVPQAFERAHRWQRPARHAPLAAAKELRRASACVALRVAQAPA